MLGLKSRLLWPGALLTLAAAFALVPLADGRVFFYWDNAQQHYVQTLFLQEGLDAGRIPQWWPDVGAGMPTVAEGQAAHFHPVRLLMALLFPAPAAFMGELAFYLAVAGLSTYAFLRRFRLPPAACFVGGVCQMLGSYSIVAVRNIALHRGLFLLPLAMLLAERFVASRNAAYVLLASVVLGVQLLAGHPVFAVVTGVATSVYVLCRVWQRAWRDRTPLRHAARQLAVSLGLWTAGGILGLGIGAVQVVPTLLHTELSVRQGGFSFEYATELAAKLTHLPQLVFPYFYAQSDWLSAPAPWGSDFNGVPHSGFYLGVLPVLLALLGLWWHRRGPLAVAPLAVSGLVAMALAMGGDTPLFAAFRSLPGMDGLRYPSRFMMWAAFCLACLAAFGFRRLLAQSRTRGRRRRTGLPFLVLASGTLALASLLWVQTPGPYDVAVAPDFRIGLLTSLVWFAAAMSLAWGLLVAGPHWRGFLVTAIAVFTCADLMYFRARSDYARSVPQREFGAPPPVAAFLKADRDRFRVMSLVSLEEGRNRNEDLFEFLQANVSSLWDIDSADIFCSLMLKRYYALHEGLLWEMAHAPEAAAKLAGFLGALNVKYVIAPTSVTLDGWTVVHSTARASAWKNPAFGPRAFLVGEVIPEEIEVRPERHARATYDRLERYRQMVDPSDWGTRLEDSQVLDNIMSLPIDYRETAVVAGEQVAALHGLTPAARVRELPERVDEMQFEVVSDQPAFLVVASSYYPGWAATVNGQPAAIHRANFVTMGVFVPAGSSTVTLRFSTPGLRAGAAMTALSSAAIGLGLVAIRRRRAKRPS
jgi:hypothetical protein